MRHLSFMSALVFLLVSSTSWAQERRWQAEGWKTDFTIKSVNFAEILSGGPPKDGIPPIDDPKFIPVVDVADLVDREPVIGLSINGDHRAYPLRVMTWHEIVNDKVGGTPVTVTYCPLCNAAIVFDARVNGEALSFGTTGKLRNSDLIMYDRKTESWWQQFIGEGIAGAYTGQKLKLVPARLESWKEFRERHPNGQVLVPNNQRMRDYGRNPYVNYDTAHAPFLYNGSMPTGIEPMARVVVIRRNGEDPLIVTMDRVRERANLEMEGYRLGWNAGQASALNSSQISQGRDVGTISATRISDGSLVAYDVTFAFVAHAFHPEVEIRGKK
ncbi:MAG: DUF3179 domain-containing protein [Rhizobiaceae bacterium]